ncbi:hypothetical protein CHISP_0467 [Chitinispirillum alkaliphilum]|nr:hypothetical protein CHISP_0467 [Chitinispirillum alkaliphilum]
MIRLLVSFPPFAVTHSLSYTFILLFQNANSWVSSNSKVVFST